MMAYGLVEPIKEFAAGRVIYGTCAGLITVARDTVEGAPPTLGLMDIVARRNAFGRQVRSFEADLAVAGLGREPMRAVFIRAPWIESAGADVDVLATYQGRIVAAREGDVLVTAFHPELTDDTRLHELFIRMIHRRQRDAAAPEGAAAARDAGEPGRTAAAVGHR
jgi:5'-phosphate synthase pdxT subunit